MLNKIIVSEELSSVMSKELLNDCILLIENSDFLSCCINQKVTDNIVIMISSVIFNEDVILKNKKDRDKTTLSEVNIYDIDALNKVNYSEDLYLAQVSNIITQYR